MKWLAQITILTVLLIPFQSIITSDYTNIQATLYVEMPAQEKEYKEAKTTDVINDNETSFQEEAEQEILKEELLEESEEDQNLTQSFNEEILEESFAKEESESFPSKKNQTQKKEEPCVKKQINRTISVTNSINDAMLGYSHWTGTYTPKVFLVRVNDKKIGYGKTKKIEITKNKFTVRYDYDFGYNVKKARGAVEVLFKIDKNASECDLTFSWDNSWRIIIDNATPISEEKCEFDA